MTTEQPPIELTEDQQKKFVNAICRVWNGIAYDILVCYAEDGDVESVVLDQDDVIEVSLDANRVEYMGGLDEEHKKLWRTLPYSQMKELAAVALPHKRWGY